MRCSRSPRVSAGIDHREPIDLAAIAADAVDGASPAHAHGASAFEATLEPAILLR